MKVLHLNRSDASGGAARAAYRIHRALLGVGIDSKMWVNHASSGDYTVESPLSTFEKLTARARPHISNVICKSLQTKNKIIHSPAILPSQWLKHINQSDVDVVNLHWIGGDMLSIADIGRIRKPIVWTLHDMWAFCGAEHLSYDNRWREGYLCNNRPKHESGFDLNRWTWERKRKHWHKPIHIVTPSTWLGSCVRESALMGNWPVSVIPNCLDIQTWQPVDRSLARDLLGLPQSVPLILFGANGHGANAAHHKGFDLLVGALKHLRGRIPQLELIIFGELSPLKTPNIDFPLRYLGYLHDDISLRLLYSAVDALLVPSRSEAFCQTASESHACGTPVVSFNVGGLSDIVAHKTTGYLARAFDERDFADGVCWTLKEDLRVSVRERAVRLFSNSQVAQQYSTCYRNI